MLVTFECSVTSAYCISSSHEIVENNLSITILLLYNVFYVRVLYRLGFLLCCGSRLLGDDDGGGLARPRYYCVRCFLLFFHIIFASFFFQYTIILVLNEKLLVWLFSWFPLPATRYCSFHFLRARTNLLCHHSQPIGMKRGRRCLWKEEHHCSMANPAVTLAIFTLPPHSSPSLSSIESFWNL